MDDVYTYPTRQRTEDWRVEIPGAVLSMSITAYGHPINPLVALEALNRMYLQMLSHLVSELPR